MKNLNSFSILNQISYMNVSHKLSYPHNSASHNFRSIPSAEHAFPRCDMRTRDMDVYLDHFSEWWMILDKIKEYFIGKRLICTPYIPRSYLSGEMSEIDLCIHDDTKALAEVGFSIYSMHRFLIF